MPCTHYQPTIATHPKTRHFVHLMAAPSLWHNDLVDARTAGPRTRRSRRSGRPTTLATAAHAAAGSRLEPAMAAHTGRAVGPGRPVALVAGRCGAAVAGNRAGTPRRIVHAGGLGKADRLDREPHGERSRVGGGALGAGPRVPRTGARKCRSTGGRVRWSNAVGRRERSASYRHRVRGARGHMPVRLLCARRHRGATEPRGRRLRAGRPVVPARQSTCADCGLRTRLRGRAAGLGKPRVPARAL